MAGLPLGNSGSGFFSSKLMHNFSAALRAPVNPEFHTVSTYIFIDFICGCFSCHHAVCKIQWSEICVHSLISVKTLLGKAGMHPGKLGSDKTTSRHAQE